jgi:transcriptional regulator with XRE-family HTH domain
MSSEPHPYLLRRLMAAKGLKQADIVRATGENKQTVNKLYLGKTQMTDRWAKMLAPLLGVTAVELKDLEGGYATRPSVAAHPSKEGAADVEERVAVRNLAPSVGDPIDDIDEAALVGFFRRLTKTGKATLFGRIGIDELPSLQEQPIRKAQ